MTGGNGGNSTTTSSPLEASTRNTETVLIQEYGVGVSVVIAASSPAALNSFTQSVSTSVGRVLPGDQHQGHSRGTAELRATADVDVEAERSAVGVSVGHMNCHGDLSGDTRLKWEGI